MTTIFELLEEYERIAPDQRTKGLYFEKLIREFLLTDPLYAVEYDEVWLWQDWPGRDGKVDTGIDLVARRRYSGELCAIQCKFFSPQHYLQKSDIDSFFTASGKKPFTSRIIVSTTNRWSKHATDALENQNIPTTRIGTDELEKSGIDWSAYRFADPSTMHRAEPKKLRTHQIDALGDVVQGFDDNDRGRLIMACGTGKTFTSLRIAERLVEPGGSVLFLAPSIALVSQTLREWAAESNRPLRAFAVCSDSKVGRNAEDFTLSDLAFPATTNAAQLVTDVAKGSNTEGLTVYFSTYQSIAVLHDAQAAGLPDFDLVVCDEAHRTAGIRGESESHFVKVHDAQYIRANKRLYMTATPKIFGESVKDKAKETAVELASMDDPDTYGPEFHRLGFGEAVERELLTDYRVLVLAVSQDAVSTEFQQQLASPDHDLQLDDAARIAGIYKALAKSGVEGLADNDLAPMRRAVAFSKSIKDSKRVQEMLADPAMIPESLRSGSEPLSLEAEHVDGTMNVMERTTKLDWLKEDSAGNITRILTNARCLSEGVDVPSLDAVIFLNSRDSQVDVVQSVGRVMRKLEGKQYGYIILPIAVPAGEKPEVALNNNAKYKVVWDVLRALRAHDERFEAKIEQFDLNRTTRDPQVQVIGIKDFTPAEGEGVERQVALDFTPLGDEWRSAVYAKMLQKVGDREYWENWAASVADVAEAQTTRILGLIDTSEEVRAEFDRFVKGLRDNLNPSVSETDALEMLSQHLITEPVLDALFEGFSFTANNPVAKAMQGMLDVLQGSNLEAELSGLDGFYASVRTRVKGITDAAGKQDFLKLLYQRFFSVAMKKASDRLGIVYTPTEIVDFILRSVDDILKEQFDSSLSAEGVHILDPFTGTGTFIAQLIHSDLIKDSDLPRKFRKELHANEINLLAYYVAAVNIEEAYQSRMGGKYVPFDGVLLTDTFQNYEAGDELDSEGIFAENNAGVIAQKELPITVIVGNPPYSVGQSSGNDDNQNLSYPSLDRRISETYAARSTASLSKSLYDSYVRAIRWASDRLSARGIIGFVTNGGFLDSNSADGMRQALAEEFSDLYLFNLRGNQRTSGERSRQEGGKIFGSGSRATIVIAILVKGNGSPGVIHYRDIGDYLTREQKLKLVGQSNRSSISWESIEPNPAGDWLGQRSGLFATFPTIGVRTVVTPGDHYFDSFAVGVASNRDAWVFASSSSSLEANVRAEIAHFNSESATTATDPKHRLDRDATKGKWTRKLERLALAGSVLEFEERAIVQSSYRPFQKQYVYLDKSLIESPGKNGLDFDRSLGANVAIVTASPSSGTDFYALVTTDAPDLHFVNSGQVFPRYRVIADNPANDQLEGFGGPSLHRVDNLSDSMLAQYRKAHGTGVSKDDIFFYVYGILHSPEYRTRFASDLKKMLPRIPKVKDFFGFTEAGRKLSELHLGYETIEPWPLEELVSTSSTNGEPDLRVVKMRYGGNARKPDKSTVIVNSDITLSGIPPEAHEYMLGSRSALDWILERYQIKTDNASGIVNDPNAWGEEHGDPRYIIDLVKRITRVSVETVAIVNSLPRLDIIDETAKD